MSEPSHPSADSGVTRSLIRTLEDGIDGFTKAAERLAEHGRADLSRLFSEYAEQRAVFAGELRAQANSDGGESTESGTVAGALHRGWMSVKDVLAGSDPDAVLAAAEQGEDHAVSRYHEALGTDIDPGLRTVVERQYIDVKRAHDTVRSLRNATS